MIIIISPSKTQRVALSPENHHDQPVFMEDTKALIRLLKALDRNDLAKLMKISEKLAGLTYERIDGFTAPHSPETAGTALTTFQGDAFSVMSTDSYNPDDFLFAQAHLRILSGLYGFLRPLDLMQPYRLEMGTRLLSDRGKNLYEFWGSAITEALNGELEKMREQVVVNCASKEYSRVIKEKQLIGPMIAITFKQEKNKVLKSIAIHAKRARGMFVDYLIKKRISDIDQLPGFRAGGYRFASSLSTSSELVFITSLD